MTAPLIVPDDDDTRQRLVEAYAWAAGIHREDIPRVTDAARRHWEILADTSLRELRLLSVAHCDGIADATVEAILARAERAEEDRAWDREQHARALAKLRDQHAETLDRLQRAEDAVRIAGKRVHYAAGRRRKTVRIDELLTGLERVHIEVEP